MSKESASGPLGDLKIVDFSRVLAGPYATMMLGDLGANVVKVERPGSGDDTRSWGPPYDASGQATYFNAVNRNKRSTVVDLTTGAGRDQALTLIASCDVVVENFRAGTMERFGLGYEELRVENPGLIYCSITGFGSGPGAALPGYDLMVQALGGLMSITGPDPGHPTKVGVALVDVLSGLHALAGILAALHHRHQTGEGQRVDVNLLSALLSSLVNQSSGYLGAGDIPEIIGNRHPSIAPYEVFEAADKALVLAVGNDKQFRLLASLLGDDALMDDPRFTSNTSRVLHRDELFAVLSEKLAERNADEWFAVLTAAGIPAGPINDVREAIALAGDLGLEPIQPIPGSSTPTIANPIQLSVSPVSYRLPPPRLDHGVDERPFAPASGFHSAILKPATSRRR